MTWTLQHAKNKFSAVVDAALAGAPQEVSRRGKLVVVLSTVDYQHLLDGVVETRESFADHLLAFPVTGESRKIDHMHASHAARCSVLNVMWSTPTCLRPHGNLSRFRWSLLGFGASRRPRSF